MLEFDYEIVAAPDGKVGNREENGSWNGMMKILAEKRADIGIGAISVMLEREVIVDFTKPISDIIGFTILMKLQRTPTSLFKFIFVMEGGVWLNILIISGFTR